MTPQVSPPPAPPGLSAWFRRGERLCSRSVGGHVHAGVVDVPVPPARLLADWQRDIALQLDLQPGDVESLPLARARARWPDYPACVAAAAGWLRTLGLPGLPADAEVALMACRGARYHHDAAQYAGAAFCNLFLSEDRGLDVHFPGTGQRIPLVRGTLLLFDTGQPHAVIDRRHDRFDGADFAGPDDRDQVFLTWELPIDQPEVARALGVRFDLHAPGVPSPTDEQLWRHGAPVAVDAASGAWRPVDRAPGV